MTFRILTLTVLVALTAACAPPMSPEQRAESDAFARQLMLEKAKTWRPYYPPGPQMPQTVTTNCTGGNGQYQCVSR